MNNVLVVAVHPDDETLGCGGTLLRLKAEGSAVHWLILTCLYFEECDCFYTITSKGEQIAWQGQFKPAKYDKYIIKRRSEEILLVSKAYNFDSVHELIFPSTFLDQIPLGKIIGEISNVVEQIQPDTIFLPFENDVHSDHRIAFHASYSCTKIFRYPSIIKILSMETISETDFAPGTQHHAFVPNMFVDISAFLDRKNQIMELYAGEYGKHPFPRSKEHIQALALHRGVAANCTYAESFVLLKYIL
jgi:N-acetylglucosamine malate deacetylase 1